MLNLNCFASEKDIQIWEYHSEGMTHRQIERMIGLEHSWITRKIARIQKYLKELDQYLLDESFAYNPP